MRSLGAIKRRRRKLSPAALLEFFSASAAARIVATQFRRGPFDGFERVMMVMAIRTVHMLVLGFIQFIELNILFCCIFGVIHIYFLKFNHLIVCICSANRSVECTNARAIPGSREE